LGDLQQNSAKVSARFSYPRKKVIKNIASVKNQIIKYDSGQTFQFIQTKQIQLKCNPLLLLLSPRQLVRRLLIIMNTTNVVLGAIELLAAFNHFDKNSDGFLSRNQFGDLLSYLGFNIGKSRVSIYTGQFKIGTNLDLLDRRIVGYDRLQQGRPNFLR
jgi:hypothetical protein